MILILCLQGGGAVAAIQQATEMDMNAIADSANRRVSCRLERFNSTLHQQQCLLQVDFCDENGEDEVEGDNFTLPWWQQAAQHIVSAPVRA